MGRELKRVPLDFDWPLDEVWKGYLNPHDEHCRNCDVCDGKGLTVARQRLEDLVFLLMISPQDAAKGKCHPWLQESALYNTQGKVCEPAIAELTSGLAGRAGDGIFGHDTIDRWVASKKIIAAAGLKEDWGLCPACAGEGSIWDSEEHRLAAESWEESEPPEGPGYQIWETVSEGSPISPVFETPEGLARHMAETRWGADNGTSYETWLKFINGPGWGPSMVMTDGVIQSGVQAMVDEE